MEWGEVVNPCSLPIPRFNSYRRATKPVFSCASGSRQQPKGMACFAPFFCLLAMCGRGLVTWLWAGCTKLARVWGLGAFAEDQTVFTENKACVMRIPLLIACAVWTVLLPACNTLESAQRDRCNQRPSRMDRDQCVEQTQQDYEAYRAHQKKQREAQGMRNWK